MPGVGEFGPDSNVHKQVLAAREAKGPNVQVSGSDRCKLRHTGLGPDCGTGVLQYLAKLSDHCPVKRHFEAARCAANGVVI